MQNFYLIIMLSLYSCSFLNEKKVIPSDNIYKKPLIIKSTSMKYKSIKNKVEINQPIKPIIQIEQEESYLSKLEKNIFNAISQNLTFKLISDFTAMDLYKGQKDNSFIPEKDIKNYSAILSTLSKKQIHQLLNIYSINKDSFINTSRRMAINNERQQSLKEFKKDSPLSFFIITALAYTVLDPLIVLLILGLITILSKLKNKINQLYKINLDKEILNR